MSAIAPFTKNDFILFVSLLYSVLDITGEPAAFSACSTPIHVWLFVSYACVVALRIVHVVGSHLAATTFTAQAHSDTSEFLLDWRHKNTISRWMAKFLWALAVPFFAGWTLLGTVWFYRVSFETRHCIPNDLHIWFIAFWLILCYVWIGAHVVLGIAGWLLERQIRAAEGNLRELEDPDLLARWGQVSQLQNYMAIPIPRGCEGLAAAQIKVLPGASTFQGDAEAQKDADCPICLCALEAGDSVRRLCGCGHTFHRSCVDLWLLRCAVCPLCKAKVGADPTAPPEWH